MSTGEDVTIEPIEIGIDELRARVAEAFAPVLRAEEAERITDALVDAECAGVPTHGVLRVPWYLDGLRSGVYSQAGRVTVTRPARGVAQLDGHGSLGYLSTWSAVDHAIAAAAECGIGIATVRGVGEFGRAGYYAAEAARRGFVAVVGQNTLPLLGPPGATVATHGNNPLAYSAPGADAPLFDAAFTPRSGGEVRRRAILGLSLPEEWGYVDAAGRPTTDPDQVAGAVQPAVGGAKGFGIAVLVDLLAGVLAGAESGHLVVPGTAAVGAFVIGLDPAAFGGVEPIAEALSASAHYVRAHGGRWPGDRAKQARADHRARGAVTVPRAIWSAMEDAIAAW